MRENKTNSVILSESNIKASSLFSMLSYLHDKGLISSKTFLETFSIDYDQELNQIAKENKGNKGNKGK